MVEKEEYNRILDELKNFEKIILGLENEEEFSALENKNVFMIRSVREETFKQALSKLNNRTPGCKLYILGRVGDDKILKQEFQGDYELFEVGNDKQYDASEIQEIIDEMKLVKLDWGIFITQDTLVASQMNLMEILYKIPCEVRGVMTKDCRIYRRCSYEYWEQYKNAKSVYDRLCDEIWESYD